MPPKCRSIQPPIMMRDKDMKEGGFSLVEVAVALGIISTGIIGTLSMIGANRALMENNWDLARMNMIAESVMTQIGAEFHTSGTLATTSDYDWSNDASNFKLTVLFTDNGYRATDASLSIAAASAPVSYNVAFTVVSPSGRSMTRNRDFYRALNDTD